MKFKKIIPVALLTLLFSSIPSFALIQIDDKSVDLAIQYGLKMKDLSSRDILGNNWINDDTGRILNIYSPFIQLVSKSTIQASTGNNKEDIPNIKNKLTNEIKKIEAKNEVRFILDLHGDKADFAKNYSCYITAINNNEEKSIIKPNKHVNQTIADKDNFDRNHPFSAVNLYTYKFSDIAKLKEYYLVIVTQNGNEAKFKVDNSKIF